LTQVDVDLIFLQANQASDMTINAEGAKKEAKFSGEAELSARRMSTLLKTPELEHKAGRHKMTCGGFLFALQAIAEHVALGAEHAGEDAACEEENIEAFCREVLDPLCHLILGGSDSDSDLIAAIALIAEDKTVNILQKSRAGLDRVFKHYAQHHKGQNHWTSTDISKFAKEFGIAAEVSHYPLQKIFRECAHHEWGEGRGSEDELTLHGFQLSLLMIAQKINGSMTDSPLNQVLLLFHRMNGAVGLKGYSGPPPKGGEALIPGLPLFSSLNAPIEKPSHRRSLLSVSKSQVSPEMWTEVMMVDAPSSPDRLGFQESESY